MNIDFSGWVREHFILIDCSYKYMGGQESFPTNKSSDSMVIDKSHDWKKTVRVALTNVLYQQRTYQLILLRRSVRLVPGFWLVNRGKYGALIGWCWSRRTTTRLVPAVELVLPSRSCDQSQLLATSSIIFFIQIFF